MQRTRIKFCGITCPEDAHEAARAGADAIGLILHPRARRFVSMSTARRIVAAVPPFVTAVGVFVDADPDEVINTADELGLSHVQLHGREPPEDVARLIPLSVIKAVRVDASVEQELDRWRRAAGSLTNLKALVLESAGDSGGSGVENDWQTIRRHMDAGNFTGLPPIIAAGGLHPGNVAAVIRLLRPWAVDVSSGVEDEPGRKSPDKLRAFHAAVHAASDI